MCARWQPVPKFDAFRCTRRVLTVARAASQGQSGSPARWKAVKARLIAGLTRRLKLDRGRSRFDRGQSLTTAAAGLTSAPWNFGIYRIG